MKRLIKRLIKRLLYLLLALFALVCAFVLTCAFNPELTEKVAEFLYEKRDGAAAQNSADVNVDILTESGEKSTFLPDQEERVVSGGVTGRSGYIPIQEDGQQLDDAAAQEIVRQLGVGETGDGLTFDPLFYSYYAMLDEKGQHLYRQIYANANALNTAFAPVEEIQADELKPVFAAVYNDHPELFWMETAYYYKYKRDGGCVELDLMYNRTAGNLAGEKALFEQNAQQILSDAAGYVSNYEREKAVHDRLLDLITYNAAAEMGQSAYSALVNGQTVCAGYARAFQYLLQQLGIPCYYCTGYAGENHAWNIVMLDDGYYNADVTWDDTEEGKYLYFNRSDAEYADTHARRDMAVNLPACNGEKYQSLEDGAEDMAGAQEALRDIETLGISPEQVIGSLPDYYADCYGKITDAGMGEYTFENVIEGEEMLAQWLQSYRSEAYKEGYMESVMEAVGASRCEMTLEMENLKDGRYLIKHRIRLD